MFFQLVSENRMCYIIHFCLNNLNFLQKKNWNSAHLPKWHSQWTKHHETLIYRLWNHQHIYLSCLVDQAQDNLAWMKSWTQFFCQFWWRFFKKRKIYCYLKIHYLVELILLRLSSPPNWSDIFKKITCIKQFKRTVDSKLCSKETVHGSQYSLYEHRYRSLWPYDSHHWCRRSQCNCFACLSSTADQLNK